MLSFLITAGPTREHLDEVRFLSNGSSGRMGYALAVAARDAGHRVTMVLGPVELPPPAQVAVVPVVSALEMQAAAAAALPAADIVIAAAAVADWRPAERCSGKPARAAAAGGRQTLELIQNPDIIAGLAAAADAAGPRRQVFVGFALDSAAVELPAAVQRGRAKLVSKRLDLVLVNLASAIGQDRSAAVLCRADGSELLLPEQSKAAIAAQLVAAAVELWQRRQAS